MIDHHSALGLRSAKRGGVIMSSVIPQGFENHQSVLMSLG